MIFLQWEVLYSAVCVSAFLHDFSREKLHPSLCGLPGIKEHSDTCLVCFCIYGEERRLHHSPLIRKVTSLSLESPAGVWREQPLCSFTLLMSTFVFINAGESRPRQREKGGGSVYPSHSSGLSFMNVLQWTIQAPAQNTVNIMKTDKIMWSSLTRTDYEWNLIVFQHSSSNIE